MASLRKRAVWLFAPLLVSKQRRRFVLLIASATGLLFVLAQLAFGARYLGGSCSFVYQDVRQLSCRHDHATAEQWCAAHGLQSRARPVRLFAFTLVDTELDILEVRLREHSGVVDKLIVLEAAETSTGRKKPYFLQSAQWLRHEFADTLVHLRADSLSSSWQGIVGLKSKASERLTWARNQMLDQTRRALNLQPDDILFLTDADEFPSREALLLVKTCNVTLPVLFSGTYSWGGFDNVESGWEAARAVSVHQLDSNGGGRLDAVRNAWESFPFPATRVSDATWHCSWCFPSTAHYFRKSISYTHHDRFDHAAQNEQWWCNSVAERSKASKLKGPLSGLVMDSASAPTPLRCFAKELERAGAGSIPHSLPLGTQWSTATLHGFALPKINLPVTLLLSYANGGAKRSQFEYLLTFSRGVSCRADVPVSSLLSPRSDDAHR